MSSFVLSQHSSHSYLHVEWRGSNWSLSRGCPLRTEGLTGCQSLLAQLEWDWIASFGAHGNKRLLALVLVRHSDAFHTYRWLVLQDQLLWLSTRQHLNDAVYLKERKRDIFLLSFRCYSAVDRQSAYILPPGKHLLYYGICNFFCLVAGPSSLILHAAPSGSSVFSSSPVSELQLYHSSLGRYILHVSLPTLVWWLASSSGVPRRIVAELQVRHQLWPLVKSLPAHTSEVVYQLILSLSWNALNPIKVSQNVLIILQHAWKFIPLAVRSSRDWALGIRLWQ